MEQIKRQLDDVIQDYNNNKKQKLQNASFRSIFENLPNEILYEIFEYLDVYHVYKGFFYLNKRFKNLLINTNLPIQINISTISKSDIELYHKNMIEPYKDRINYLRLSNPFTVDIIFSPPRIICDFTQLEILIFDNINTKYLNNILKHLTYLPKLNSLILSPIDYIQDPGTLFLHIFRIPTLKSCKITYRTTNDKESLPIYFDKYEHSSIENLMINSPIRFESLNHLLICLPKLRYLLIDCLIGSNNSRVVLYPIILKDLKYISFNLNSIHFYQFEELIKNFFIHTEILYISISNDETYLHAKQWEELIKSSMPNLRIFDIIHENSIEIQSYIYYFLFLKFSYSFWSKNQWFFSHQYNWEEKLTNGIFHSINPYRRKDYKLYWRLDQQIYSHNQENNFNSVKHLHICNKKAIYNCVNYFPNVTQLTIKHYFKIPNDSISIILNQIIPLKQLNKLFIECYDFPVERIIKLLCFTPNLHTLKLNSLSIYETSLILIQQNEIFRYVSNTNKIKNLELPYWCSLENIELISNLFPQVEYLKTGIYRKEIIRITRYLLTKMHYLFFLCIKEIPKTCLQEINLLIQSENLLDDYFIKFINRRLYLWW